MMWEGHESAVLVAAHRGERFTAPENTMTAFRRAAALGGAGEDFPRDALAAGADVYVTGEMGYHRALFAVDDGLCVVEAGHAATEAPAVFLLADALQTAADALQYNLRVLCSQRELFL